jgi:undecaprenyl-diphosphatase
MRLNACRHTYRLRAFTRASAPEEAAGRRVAAVGLAVLASGLVGAAGLCRVADGHTLVIVRAAVGPCRAAAALVTRFGEGWETLLPGFLVLAVCLFRTWRGEPVGARLVRLGWVMGFVVLSVGGSGLLAWLLKNAVGRARPLTADTLVWLQHPFAFTARFASFPSGHATTAGATAVVLALLFPRRAGLIFTVCGVVAASRVVVGMHFPSDVAAGFAFGAGVTLLIAAEFLRRGRVFQLCGGRLWRQPVAVPATTAPLSSAPSAVPG